MILHLWQAEKAKAPKSQKSRKISKNTSKKSKKYFFEKILQENPDTGLLCPFIHPTAEGIWSAAGIYVGLGDTIILLIVHLS